MYLGQRQTCQIVHGACNGCHKTFREYQSATGCMLMLRWRRLHLFKEMVGALDRRGYGTVPWPETKEQGNDDTGANADTGKRQQNPARMHRMAPLRQGSPSTPSHRVHQKSHDGINPQNRMPQRIESDLKHQRAWERRWLRSLPLRQSLSRDLWHKRSRRQVLL